MIKPFGMRVAVVDPPAEKQTGMSGGLVVPAGFDVLNRGIVAGVGDGVPHLSEGMLVWYRHDCGTELKDGIKVIPAECVLAYDDGE